MSEYIHPGDVVVCVDATPDQKDPAADLLALGAYYRVAVVGVRDDGELACAFRSIPHPEDPGFGLAFCIRRFRKLRPADPDFIERVKRQTVLA